MYECLTRPAIYYGGIKAPPRQAIRQVRNTSTYYWSRAYGDGEAFALSGCSEGTNNGLHGLASVITGSTNDIFA